MYDAAPVIIAAPIQPQKSVNLAILEVRLNA